MFTEEKQVSVILEFIVKKLARGCLESIMGVLMEKIIARIIEEIVNRLSPEIKTAIKEAVLKLETAAAATSNPWDDIAVKCLKAALNIT